MLARFPSGPLRELRREDVARLVARFTKQGRDLEILDAKEEGEAAIVIVNDKGGVKTVDIDPLLLFRQHGEWKVVLPDYRLIHRYGTNIAPSLGEWYSKRKDELKDELIGDQAK